MPPITSRLISRAGACRRGEERRLVLWSRLRGRLLCGERHPLPRSCVSPSKSFPQGHPRACERLGGRLASLRLARHEDQLGLHRPQVQEEPNLVGGWVSSRVDSGQVRSHTHALLWDLGGVWSVWPWEAGSLEEFGSQGHTPRRGEHAQGQAEATWARRRGAPRLPVTLILVTTDSGIQPSLQEADGPVWPADRWPGTQMCPSTRTYDQQCPVRLTGTVFGEGSEDTEGPTGKVTW